uniref:Uncharacterized protein n=2 Tax=Meloidogyne TaxID=189290 RepID=A0A6V7U747_MELEN|nr:unnamed protein product [Meloidogyne enterolobii]CAD2197486.1 unnamed protein product [Meloidogyne enterolobii]CAD2208655.1 unnamed protein product [Meloidogyne enterolobii]
MTRTIILLFLIVLTAQIIKCKSSHAPTSTFFFIKSSLNDLLKSRVGILQNQEGKRSLNTNSLQLLKRLQQRNVENEAIGDYARVMRSAANKQSPDWSDLGWAWG